MEEGEDRALTLSTFRSYGQPLETVAYFKYLGRVIYAVDEDCLSVIRNMVNAWVFWRRMTRILSREGVRPRVSGFFFKASIQSVWCGYVVGYPPHGTGPRGIPVPGEAATDGEAYAAVVR